MESLSIFNACPHTVAQCCSAPHRTNVASLTGIQRSTGGLHSLKPTIAHSKLFSFSTHGLRRKSFHKIVKAGETEVSQQATEGEAKKFEDTITEAAAQVSSAVTPDSSTKEGASTGKYWSLRAASEGGKTHEIPPGDGLVIGAAPDGKGSSVPLVIDIPTVSSSHARVYSRESQSYQTTTHEYFVMDLGSTNGTYLNRSKLRPRTEVKLSNGDNLKFGGDEKAAFVVES